MNPVRKLWFVLLLLILTACCACAAADTEYSLSPCAGRFMLSDDYIILTPDNLADHPELLSGIGRSAEELAADWAERGVIIQAWTKKQDAYLEVAVVQDDNAKKYYDRYGQCK